MIGFEGGQSCDIAHRAIAVVRENSKLLPGLEIHFANGGDSFDPFQHRIFRGAIGHALANPAGDQIPFVGAGGHALPTTVGQNVRGFLQQQAEVGVCGENAATAIFVHKELVVFFGVESEQ